MHVASEFSAAFVYRRLFKFIPSFVATSTPCCIRLRHAQRSPTLGNATLAD